MDFDLCSFWFALIPGWFATEFHKPDRQSNLTGLTFTALTPPAALLDVILAVL